MADTTTRAGALGATHAHAIPKSLLEVALEATFEIEGLLQSLAHHLPLPSTEPELYVIRGMALRAAQLNEAVMSALGDAEACDVEEIERKVFGRITAQQRAEERAAEVAHV